MSMFLQLDMVTYSLTSCQWTPFMPCLLFWEACFLTMPLSSYESSCYNKTIPYLMGIIMFHVMWVRLYLARAAWDIGLEWRTSCVHTFVRNIMMSPTIQLIQLNVIFFDTFGWGLFTLFINVILTLHCVKDHNNVTTKYLKEHVIIYVDLVGGI